MLRAKKLLVLAAALLQFVGFYAVNPHQNAY